MHGAPRRSSGGVVSKLSFLTFGRIVIPHTKSVKSSCRMGSSSPWPSSGAAARLDGRRRPPVAAVLARNTWTQGLTWVGSVATVHGPSRFYGGGGTPVKL